MKSATDTHQSMTGTWQYHPGHRVVNHPAQDGHHCQRVRIPTQGPPHPMT